MGYPSGNADLLPQERLLISACKGLSDNEIIRVLDYINEVRAKNYFLKQPENAFKSLVAEERSTALDDYYKEHKKNKPENYDKEEF